MKKTILILALLTLSAPAWATAYYVANAGNDSCNGTSSTIGSSGACAWKTISKVSGTTLAAGSSVLFNCGDTWREQLQPHNGGSVGSPVVFSTYGTCSGSNNPIISGSNLVTSWTTYSGSIYQASLATAPRNVYSDGLPSWGLAKAASLVGMTSGTWWWVSNVLYVWLPDSSNPSGHSMEAAIRLAGVYVNTGTGGNFSYLTISNFQIQRTSTYGIYLHNYGTVSPFTSVTVSNNTLAQTGGGIVDNGYYNQLFILDEDYPASSGVKITGNKLSYCGDHNCLQMQGTGAVEISSNDVSEWNHNGIDVKDAPNASVDGNYVHDMTTIGAAFYIECDLIPCSVTWNNNTIYNVSNGFECSSASSFALTCSAYNNSMFNLSNTGTVLALPNATSTAVVYSKNNAASGVSSYIYNTGGSTAGITLYSDYNDVYGGTGSFWNGTTYGSLGSWHTATGQDAHSLIVGPQFVNAPTSFALQPTSPLINMGTLVGLPYSGCAPDIGAVEFVGRSCGISPFWYAIP